MLLLRQGTQEEEQMAWGVGNRQGSVGGLGSMYFQGKRALGLGVSEMDLLSYGQQLELEKRMGGVCVVSHALDWWWP